MSSRKDSKKLADKNAADIIKGISEGQPPSNLQVESAINTAEESLDKNTRRAGPEAKEFAENVTTLLEDTKQLLDEKNKDEKFQKFAKTAMDIVTEDVPTVAKAAGKEVQKKGKNYQSSYLYDKETDAAKRFFDNSRIIAVKLIRSGEFRRMLLDCSDILLEIFGEIDLNQLKDKAIDKVQEKVDQSREPEEKKQRTITFEENKSTTFSGRGEIDTTRQVFGSAPSTVLPSETIPDINKNLESTTPVVSDEKKQELRDRVKQFLRTISSQEEYHRALRALFEMAEDFKFSAKQIKEDVQDVKDKAKSTAQRTGADDKVDTLMQTGRSILEEFSGQQSLDTFVEKWNDLSEKVKNDERLFSYLKEWRETIFELMENPELIDNNEWQEQINDLIDRGNGLMKQYRPYYDSFVSEGKEFFGRIQDDKMLNKIKLDSEKLLNQFVVRDSRGNLSLNTELLMELRKMLVPLVMDQLKSIPLPKIETRVSGFFGSYDVTLDNLSFSAYDVVPDRFKVKIFNDLDFNLKKLEAEKAKTRMYFKVKNISVKMSDIKMHYRRVQLPHISDSLTVDLDLAGDGMKVVVESSFALVNNEPKFEVKRIYCKIDKLKINARNTNMRLIYDIMTSLFKNSIKHNVEQRVESTLKNILLPITDQMNILAKNIANVNVGNTIAQNLNVAKEKLQTAVTDKDSTIKTG